tara:strand:+ start:9362 stop:11710 length:2349 start_codon:yes stop_codon:yes gene_type:complete
MNISDNYKNLKRKRNDDLDDYNYITFLSDKEYNYNQNFLNYKKLVLKSYISENSTILLDDFTYFESNDLKFKPDCFSECGSLIDIYISIKKNNEFYNNGIPKHYFDYIQILLNTFKINKCIIPVYHITEYNNGRECRQNNADLNIGDYGFIISQPNDIYYTLKFEKTIEIKRKRFFSDYKKFKQDYLDETWIGASKTRNYSLGDPCIDYYRTYNLLDINDIPNKNVFSFDPSSKYERENKTEDQAISFIDCLLTSGNNFEVKIINEIKKKYKKHFIEICNSYQSRNIKYYNKTLKCMEDGIPIIYQAVLYNYENKTFGSADLIIRSDFINKIVKTRTLSDEEININAPKFLKHKYHYRVIDIKNSIMHLNVDDKTIRNNNNVKPFKTQIAVYNMALEQMQGYLPDQSYILGNGWILQKTVNKQQINRKSRNPFDKFGIIDFNQKDSEYYDTANYALEWLKLIQNNSNKLIHNPPNDPRLYPNMCNSYDGIYHKIKQQIAEEIDEITCIWQCGKQNREIAHSKNIYSWKDPNCTAEILGFSGNKIKKMIDKMLGFNRDGKSNININIIDHNNLNWRSEDLTFYVDFETISSFLLTLNDKSNINVDGDFLFMIGVGWKEPNDDKWNYDCIYANDVSLNEEKRIVGLFINKINDLNTKFSANGKLVHWSQAENIIFRKVCNRHNIFKSLNWFDLLGFFKENEILILGALNFSLKTIAKAMNKHGMIESIWEDDITNGLDAMFFSWKEYLKNNNITQSGIFKNIIKYNEIDCKTTFEILQYLKINH